MFDFINLLGFWVSAITMSLLCKIDATKRKMEHIPNMTVMGKASTFKMEETVNTATKKDTITKSEFDVNMETRNFIMFMK